jgi:hypothetical protein
MDNKLASSMSEHNKDEGSPDKRFDLNSELTDNFDAAPNFDNLPSLRSNSQAPLSGRVGLTAQKLQQLQKDYEKQKAFEALPSMNSSITGARKQLDPSSMIQDSERSYTE